MEPVTTLITCLFVSFCAPDGTCTTDAPLQVSLAFGAGSDAIDLWTGPDTSGRPLRADPLPPLPARAGEALNLLARSGQEGALLVSLRRAAAGPTATLRRHPDRNGNPTGPGAQAAEATTCTQSFAAP